MHRRQMIQFGMRPNLVVVLREFPQDVVQVPLPEDQKSPQALQLDRLNHPFAAPVQVLLHPL